MVAITQMHSIEELEELTSIQFHARNIRNELRRCFGIGGRVFKRGAATLALNIIYAYACEHPERKFWSLGDLTNDEFYYVMQAVRPYKRRVY